MNAGSPARDAATRVTNGWPPSAILCETARDAPMAASMRTGVGPQCEGLDSATVAARVAAGEVNRATDHTSRRTGEILRSNLVTRFNALLGSLFVVIVVIGPAQDALFGAVLIANAAIGITQELRAKRTLDRLSLLSEPAVVVVRDGRRQSVVHEGVVRGDVVEAGRGDQIVADGVVLQADGATIDESLLTGESMAVDKARGDMLLSGTAVVSGTVRYRADAVGDRSYVHRLAAEGRRFSLARSELRAGIDTVLRGVTWILIPTAALLVVSQLVQANDRGEALRVSVAGVVAMVPEGLVLLTSTALAVGVIRLGHQQVLVQELGALEGLARVDVLCLDKTGTLTDAELRVVAVDSLPGAGGIDVADVLAGFAASDLDPNPSIAAIRRAHEVMPWNVSWRVPFSSATRWSAIAVGSVAWALGAPDVLLQWAPGDFDDDIAMANRIVAEHTALGRRVLVLGRYSAHRRDHRPAGRVQPIAVIALEERIRSDAATTVAWFAARGVELKVLSGDDPRTVAAVAKQVGLTGAADRVDARTLPSDPESLVRSIADRTVFGRVTPDGKRTIIDALQRSGHTVGMIGDGVNDLLALKQADLGIAMGSGAPAARAIARVVLLDSSFATLPSVVAEGRRVIANIEQVAKLFVTKTVYACLLALAIGIVRFQFPFLPRHLTVISSLTIGVPAFFLALQRNDTRSTGRFTAEVLRVALPAGAVAAIATFAGYAFSRTRGVTIAEARTTATLVLFGVAMWVLWQLSRPLTRWRTLLLVAMTAVFVIAVTTSGPRTFFAFDLPEAITMIAVIGIVAAAGALLELGRRHGIVGRPS